MKKISLILVEDHAVVRQGLSSLINSEVDMEVIGEAKNGRQAVKLSIQLKPSVVIMDIAMPGLNGFEAIRQILKKAPATKIIVLSAHDIDEYFEHVIKLGASGYLLKQSSVNILFKAIREVHKGNTFFSPSILKNIKNKRDKFINRTGLYNEKNMTLSSRENEVLQLIAESMANKEIASELKISIKTIEKHRQKLMDKLNIHNTAGLTRYAISKGIIDSNIRVDINK